MRVNTRARSVARERFRRSCALPTRLTGAAQGCAVTASQRRAVGASAKCREVAHVRHTSLSALTGKSVTHSCWLSAKAQIATDRGRLVPGSAWGSLLHSSRARLEGGAREGGAERRRSGETRAGDGRDSRAPRRRLGRAHSSAHPERTACANRAPARSQHERASAHDKPAVPVRPRGRSLHAVL